MTYQRKDEEFKSNLGGRKATAGAWNLIFMVSTLVGVLALVALIASLLNSCFGYVILDDSVPFSEISAVSEVPFEKQNADQLRQAVQNALDNGYLMDGRLKILVEKKPLEKMDTLELQKLVSKEILQPQIVRAWTLMDSLFSGNAVKKLQQEKYPEGHVIFRSWISADFLVQSQARDALNSGIKGAIIGSFWIILIAIVFALPIGIGAAIYLEEYAKDNRWNRFIQTNIYNLAGVPSIIYGMLGLAIFVRVMEPFTSGEIFGVTDMNGRTVFSAGLTLGILILPIIIINTQEALKAIPNSLRESSFGIGATRWQTVWHHVLPAAMDRILTGTVFGISRAIGETAPLVVVGASAFLTVDPSGLFSKFTTLPMQIYTLSQQPQAEFQHIAAAAIIVLLVLLLGLNSVAIVLRNRIKKNKEAL